jgi:hypothetical protein
VSISRSRGVFLGMVQGEVTVQGSWRPSPWDLCVVFRSAQADSAPAPDCATREARHLNQAQISPAQETLPLAPGDVRVDLPHRHNGKEPLPGSARPSRRFLAP